MFIFKILAIYISNWNTINVNNMNLLFYECSSLKSLSDISNWNTINVTDIGGLFCVCSSLISLPDISNWNSSNVANISLKISIKLN